MSLEQFPLSYETEEEAAEWMKEQSLASLREQLAAGQYPGYPEFEKRLYLETISYGPFGEADIISGTWTLDYILPVREDDIALHQTDLKFDRMRRPLHPWFEDMVTDSDIRVVQGRGKFWNWGPNYTADPIVIRGNDVLLIKRGDTGHWALPGGFLNRNEDPEVAARRELLEETGIVLPAETLATNIYSGPVADIRLTANAWPETTAIAYHLGADFDIEPTGQDDAVAAAWVPIELALQEPLFGSHQLLLKLALDAQVTS